MPDLRDRGASISVVLPFRDAAATIDAALSGLLAQADPGREVIAIDDGSTDSGAQRVRTWAARDPRVKLVQGHGRGLVAALNLGLQHARGSLIARMDADDIAHPERLGRQREHLCAHPELAILGCQVEAFSDDGPLGEGLARYVAWQNGLLTSEQHAHARFVESPLCHPSIVVRRTVLDDIGHYRAFDGPEDYELFLRCVARGHQLAKLPEVLLRWRHSAGRATFHDERYTRSKFRSMKAPYLIEMLQDRQAVIWGAGRTGRRLARALADHGSRPARFIDVDPLKIGRSAQGAPIAGVDSLDCARDVVIAAVAVRGARELIRPQLLELGFREGDNAWFAS
jgi:glycosyltransferase involved in cell wall biosynthesis